MGKTANRNPCRHRKLDGVEKKPTMKATAPKIEAPQWLIDHMATAPKKLRNYVFKVFPERRTNSVANGLSGSFAWEELLEGHDFWSHVNSQNWGVALDELRKKNLL